MGSATIGNLMERITQANYGSETVVVSVMRGPWGTLVGYFQGYRVVSGDRGDTWTVIGEGLVFPATGYDPLT